MAEWRVGSRRVRLRFNVEIVIVILPTAFVTAHHVQQRGLYGGRQGCGRLGARWGPTVAGAVAEIKADARLKGTLERTFCGRHGFDLV